jgi:signal transduction histidine kinase
MRLAALRAPLLVKVVGANAVGVAVITALWVGGWISPGLPVIVATAGLVLAHLGLVMVALRPVRDLEVIASRVWRGDYGARVEASAVADQQVMRVGSMFNTLLDALTSDRARVRELASQIVEIADRERAALARELHDSTAQRLAALLFQISAAARDCRDSEIAERLASARDAAEQVTEEVRLLAHTVHPSVLDDLGLAPALRTLAREASRVTGIDVDVEPPTRLVQLPRRVTSVLYRVAQESVRNAAQHASPHRVRIVLRTHPDEARLEVHDDGSGFDLADAERRRPGMGLFIMRERVALVDGQFELRTAPESGTSVIASVPLGPECQTQGAHNVR